MPEKKLSANEITAQLLIEIPQRFHDVVRCWRNNRVSAMAPGKDGRPRMVKAGIDGQADISGIAKVHKRFGVRLEIEVKAKRDTLSEDQKNFGAMIRSLGGIYLVARDVEECMEALERMLEA